MKTLFTMDKAMARLPAGNRKNWYWEVDYLVKHLEPLTKVLQIGSCDGIRLDYLASRRKDIRFVGLEIDKKLSAEANKRFKKYHGRIKSVCGDARKIPFRESTFDYALCLNNTLGYIPNNKKVISELKRVVFSGGKIIVSVYGPQWGNRIARQYFEKLGAKTITITGDVCMIDGITMKRYSKHKLVELLGKKTAIMNSVIGFMGILRK